MTEKNKTPAVNNVAYDNSSNSFGSVTISYVGSKVQKEEPKQHPYVPVRIDAAPEDGVVVVHWNDGDETKVTCDTDDTFSVDAGYAQALKYKLFGGKTEYKEKWLRIIARRVHLHTSKPKAVKSKSKQKEKKLNAAIASRKVQ